MTVPFGGGSIQVARIFGIRVGVTTSWFFVLFLFIFLLSSSFRSVLGGSDTQAYAVAVGASLLFYVSLVLHELGHALVARRQGITVDRIDLWLFGGMAVLNREPRSPGAEFAVAVAGPVVTALVVVVCAIAASFVDTSAHFMDAALLRATINASPAYVLLSFVATMNAVLLVFNLAPAFPLDGGRIALAIAWKVTGDRARATRLAGRAGVLFAYAFGGLGVYLLIRGDAGDGIWFLLLAYILGGAARGAIVRGTIDERLHEVTVADVMDRHVIALPGATTLLEAREQVFDGQPWPFVAVVDDDGRFLGVLRRETLQHELEAGRPALAVRDAVEAEPATWLVSTEQPLEALLAAEGLRRIGAVFAVDGQGILRGVVTMDVLRRAVTPAGGR